MRQPTARSWRRFKSMLRPATRILFPPTPRSENDYATHVPVLIGLAALRQVERVLELGCGNFSTKTFLNRSAFPHLKQLQSLENDPAWCATMRASVKHDSRCNVTFVTGAIANELSTLDLELFDLILIDDSTCSEERAATIRSISALHPKNPCIVIHDYEVDEYRSAASAFAHRFAFKAYNPYTGVVFNDATPRKNELKALDECLKSNKSLLEPDDVAAWIDAVHR